MKIIDAATAEQVQGIIASQPRVLVDFHKDQCPACRMLDVALQRVAGSGAAQGVTLLRVRMEVVGEGFFRGLGLRQTPTLALFRDGRELLRMPGYQSPPQIEAAMAAHLA